MKKPLGLRVLLFLPIAAAFVLECLPWGAVCVFSPGPDETLRQTFSYFDPVPFGYANFAPLITGLFTVLLLAFGIAQLGSPNPNRQRTVGMLAAVGAVLSVCPVFLGLRFYSVTGGAITLLLTITAVLHLWIRPEKTDAGTKE